MKLVTIVFTIFMVAKAKAEDNDYSPQAFNDVYNCLQSKNVLRDRNTRATCEGLEAVINCSGKFAELGFVFIGGISPLTWGPGYEITGPNDNCFIEKFDELFNQDGQCSFQI